MADPKFIHLNCHSSYSLLEGVPSVKALAERAKDCGMPAIGITDTNNIFGGVEMGNYVPGFGVQPIIGTQLGITLEGGEDYNPAMPDAGLINILVQNETGWRNIIKLSSKASLEAPENCASQIKLSDLEGMTDGLILMTGSVREGLIGKYLLANRKEDAKKVLEQLASLFEGRTYVEIQRHGMAEEIQTESTYLEFAYDMNLPLVATNDIRYIDPEQSFPFEVMLCIGESMTISNPDRRKFSDQHYFKTQEEMCELFSDLPEAIDNTVKIAKRCAFIVPTDTYYMPAWLKDEGDEREVDQIMIDDAREGLRERMEKFVFPLCKTEEDKQAKIKEYDERLDYEIGIICRMGYSGYFLITSDFIKWSKQEDIPVGPGRGSGAGSLVAWAMAITDIDPIPFDLYFERFLNPERVSLPDFDIDFCQTHRLRVVDYVRRKYGDECTSQIITFGTLKAKACIRDVGRVMDMSFGQVSKVAGFVPEGPGNFTIEGCLADDERFQEMYDNEEEVKEVIDICMKLEGAYRHASTHAAGVMICDRPIDQICPLYRDPRAPMPATQFAMVEAEMAGLVKFDFLGLKTLTVIKTCVDMLVGRGKLDKGFDVNLIPIDDKPTFDMLKAGHTCGVFQVESKGMTDFLVRMEPDKFSYLSDVVALYRPGPLESGMTDDFIECRHGRKEPVYPHEALIPVLEETFGVPVYQEQVMRMAQVMAGYTLGGADMLRRAMGKKKPSEMVKQRKLFNEGSAKEHGLSKEESDKIFDLMENFAGYGFNKAHTVAYGWVSYQTAYLKAHYPLEFLAASMTLDRGMSDKVLKFKRELERMNAPLLIPNINKSDILFRVEGDGVRFALTAIKGAGEDAMEAIVKERAENGDYKDIYDLMERIEPAFMNKKQLEVLIKAGAFDEMEPNRAYLAANVDVLLGYMQTFHKEKNSNQIGLFGGGDGPKLERPALNKAVAWDPFEKLENEQSAIGFYLSDHPLNVYRDELSKHRDLKDVVNLENLAMGDIKKVKVACIVNEVRELKTKKGDRMAILTISDSSGQEEVAMFPKTYDQYYETLKNSVPSFAEIQLSYEEERVRMNIESMVDLEKNLKKEDRVSIHVETMDRLQDLKDLFDKQGAGGKTVCHVSYNVEKLGRVHLKLKKPVNMTRKVQLKMQTLGEVTVH